MNDKVLDFVVNAVRQQELIRYEDERSKDPVPPSLFSVTRPAGELVQPCWIKAAHHREREKHYVAKLEEAEKKLREEGVSMEVFDSSTGTFLGYQNVASGNLGIPQQNFQPRIDQGMLDAVKNNKNKMLEHRSKAEDYERYARAFACGPEQLVKLSVADVTYFGLGAADVRDV